MKKKHIVILGAGPGGLACAWKLSEAGFSLEVIEQESQVGGLCRTIRRDGFCFDLGGHRFITKDNQIQDEIENLMGDDLLVRPRKSVIRLRGKYFRYPLQVRDVLSKLSPAFNMKAFLDYSITSILQRIFPRPDSSFESWVTNRFGATLYEMYFAPYSQKLWGVSPNMISSAWADQRISLINLWDVLLRLLGKKKDMPKTYAQSFYYPKKGIGQICEAMAQKVILNNGLIHLNTKVERITVRSNEAIDILCSKDGQYRKIKADYYISTIPLPDLTRMIRPRTDAKFCAIAEEMDFRSIRFLHLLVERARISDNTWIYIPESKFLFFRIQELRNWSQTCVPNNKTALTLEIACNEDDDIWRADEKYIFDICFDNLKELGLLKSKREVLDYFSSKTKHGYPMYTLDYSHKLDTLLRLILPIKNLITIGRQGLYRYNNMDHSIKMGILAASHLENGYPKEAIFSIGTEKKIFDWQDPGR